MLCIYLFHQDWWRECSGLSHDIAISRLHHAYDMIIIWVKTSCLTKPSSDNLQKTLTQLDLPFQNQTVYEVAFLFINLIHNRIQKRKLPQTHPQETEKLCKTERGDAEELIWMFQISWWNILKVRAKGCQSFQFISPKYLTTPYFFISHKPYILGSVLWLRCYI